MGHYAKERLWAAPEYIISPDSHFVLQTLFSLSIVLQTSKHLSLLKPLWMPYFFIEQISHSWQQKEGNKFAGGSGLYFYTSPK